MFYWFLILLFGFFFFQPTPIYEFHSHPYTLILPLKTYGSMSQHWYTNEEYRFRLFAFEWQVDSIKKGEESLYKIGIRSKNHSCWVEIQSNPLQSFIYQKINQNIRQYFVNVSLWDYKRVEFRFYRNQLQLLLDSYPIQIFEIQDTNFCTAYYCYQKASLFQSFITNTTGSQWNLQIQRVQVNQ